jgi:anion-transporting  ArsA/GET3 family ATPase
VAGKGGVGKTTVSAALAVAAVGRGLKVLLVDLEGKSGLPSLFGLDSVGYEAATVDLPTSAAGGSLHVRRLTPDSALLDYLNTHGLKRISNRMSKAGIVDIVSTATPGLRDLLVLGKIKQLERGDEYDLIIVDAPAAGHAISFLRSPAGVRDSTTTGALYSQASEVLEMLGDPSRCSVVLVTLPEETPMSELVDTAFQLEDEVGVMLGPVICNGWWPAEPELRAIPAATAAAADEGIDDADTVSVVSAARFYNHRVDLQQQLIERLRQRLPLETLLLSYRFTAHLDRTDIESMAAELDAQLRDEEVDA